MCKIVTNGFFSQKNNFIYIYVFSKAFFHLNEKKYFILLINKRKNTKETIKKNKEKINN